MQPPPPGTMMGRPANVAREADRSKLTLPCGQLLLWTIADQGALRTDNPTACWFVEAPAVKPFWISPRTVECCLVGAGKTFSHLISASYEALVLLSAGRKKPKLGLVEFFWPPEVGHIEFLAILG